MTRLSGRLAAVRQRRRVAVREIVRLLAIAVALFGLYYVVPLDSLTSVPLGLTLTVGLLVLGAVSAWQLRAVIDAEHPSTRAVKIGNARHQPGNQAAAAPVDSSAGSDSTHNRKPE